MLKLFPDYSTTHCLVVYKQMITALHRKKHPGLGKQQRRGKVKARTCTGKERDVH